MYIYAVEASPNEVAVEDGKLHITSNNAQLHIASSLLTSRMLVTENRSSKVCPGWHVFINASPTKKSTDMFSTQHSNLKVITAGSLAAIQFSSA